MFFQRASRDGKLFWCFVPVSILKNNFGGFSRSPFTSAAGRDEDRGRENCAILVRISSESFAACDNMKGNLHRVEAHHALSFE